MCVYIVILNSGLTQNITELTGNINNVNVYVGNDGKLHFVNKDGADSVLPFSGGAQVFYLGTGTSFNIKTKLPDIYNKLTTSNFIVCIPSSLSGSCSGGGRGSNGASRSYSTTPSYNYNASTGLLSVSGTGASGGIGADEGNGHWASGNANMSGIKAYVVVGDIK